MSGAVRKAVIPVAGFGTRVLPATKVIPKEMLPVYDRPALQYVVDEALAAHLHASKLLVLRRPYDRHAMFGDSGSSGLAAASGSIKLLLRALF